MNLMFRAIIASFIFTTTINHLAQAKPYTCQPQTSENQLSTQEENSHFKVVIQGRKDRGPFCSACLNDPIGHCVEASCDRLYKRDCNTRKQLTDIAQNCQGNYGGGCLKTICQFLPNSACNDPHEIKEIARSCRGNVGGRCIKRICSRLRSYECNEAHELIDIAKSCASGL